MPDIDVSTLKLSIKQVVAIIATVVTILTSVGGSYYGISTHLQAVDATMQQQIRTTEELRAEVKVLSDRNDALKQQMLELTITLKVKGIIQ